MKHCVVCNRIAIRWFRLDCPTGKFTLHVGCFMKIMSGEVKPLEKSVKL